MDQFEVQAIRRLAGCPAERAGDRPLGGEPLEHGRCRRLPSPRESRRDRRLEMRRRSAPPRPRLAPAGASAGALPAGPPASSARWPPTAASSVAWSGSGVVPGGAADDEMDACQHRLGERRIECRDMAVIGGRQVFADPEPHVAVVAVARHEDDHRNEAIEFVDARTARGCAAALRAPGSPWRNRRADRRRSGRARRVDRFRGY